MSLGSRALRALSIIDMIRIHSVELGRGKLSFLITLSAVVASQKGRRVGEGH
jgi:hypothetical protein